MSNDRIEQIKVALFYFLKMFLGLVNLWSISVKYAEHVNVIGPVLYIAEKRIESTVLKTSTKTKYN